MRAGIVVAVVLLLGALLAQVLLVDPGHVALTFHGYLVETSVPVLVLALVLAYLAVRLVSHLWNARRTFVRARERRHQDRAHRALVKGLLELAEGSWHAAEQTLARSAEADEAAAAHFLAAARAAELQGAAERRDQWIARARTAAPGAAAPTLITRAEFELKHKRFAAALHTLEELDATGEQNPRGVLLLARVYRHLGRWAELDALEPKLRDVKELPPETVQEILEQSHLERIRAAGLAQDTAQLEAAWQKVPKALARRPEVAVTYARAAMACGEQRAAQKTLAALLEKHWDDSAVLAFGDLETDDALAVLETAQGWLRHHETDASLLLTCAKLSVRAELYGKARSYLEASLGVRPRLEAYQLLAYLLEQIGERDRAIDALNEALTLAVGRRVTAPRVQRRFLVERRRAERRREG